MGDIFAILSEAGMGKNDSTFVCISVAALNPIAIFVFLIYYYEMFCPPLSK